MASRKKQRGSKRRERRRRQSERMRGRSLGFEDVGVDNPFEHSPFVESATEDTLTRLQRRFNAENRRRQTFATKPNLGITEGYETVTSILGSEIFHMLKESTSLDSTQVIELVKIFDQNVPAQVVEQALLNYMSELTMPSYVSIEAIEEALAAGFDIDEAVEYAELLASEVDSQVSPESAFVDIQGIIEELLREMRRNGNL